MNPHRYLPAVTASAVLGFGVAATAAGAEPEAAIASAAVTTARPDWEGAIGLNLGYRPEYSGAAQHAVKAAPGFFLRWGRFTITNSSGFVTRRSDDVVRGLGLDLIRDDRLRLNLALRYDAGRSETTSADLAGTGDIKPTVRARASASYRLDGPWRLGASWSVDAFGRGGGSSGDVSVGWDHALGAQTTLGAGLSLGFAADRYMQTYYGINEAQALRTGYPVYTPKAGLRDLSVYANARHDLGEDWIVLGGASVTRLLGPAADSPLTTRRSNWGLNVGLARRF